MRVSCTYGSVRGAAGDRRPYRDASGKVTPRSWKAAFGRGCVTTPAFGASITGGQNEQ
jgi:hypothetical protein